MATPDHLLQEDGFRIELESSTNHLVLESSTTLDDVVSILGFVPTGIPGVYSDGEGNLLVSIDSAGAITDIETGIPGVTATVAGELRVALDSLSPVVPTGIPGVLATLDRQLCVTEGGSDVIATGIPGVYCDGAGNLRVKLNDICVVDSGIPGVLTDDGKLGVKG